MSEYIVDFGDEKSSAFVRLAMAQAEANGARLCEEVVRCRDCAHWATETKFTGMCVGKQFNPDGFCAWSEKKEER